MWDIVELILSGFFECAEFLAGWRFYLSLIAAAAAIAVIYLNVESDRLSLALSAPLAVGMLMAGVLWEYNAA